MSRRSNLSSSRRSFIGQAAQLGVAAAVTGCATGQQSRVDTPPSTSSASSGSDWDLSWVKRVTTATDRAVFDSTGLSDGLALDLATRYMDNCDAVYGIRGHHAIVVLNVRVRAIAFGLNDALWNRYALGAEYDVKDAATQLPALRNPFLTPRPGASAGSGSINNLVGRGAILLVCDFALGHLATRLATKAGRTAEDVHRDLRAGFVPGAIAMPSGLFGLAKAQNAGCGYLLG